MGKMDRLQVTRSGEFSYSIDLEKDFSRMGQRIAQCREKGGKACVVTDTNVEPLYGQAVREELEKIFSKVTFFVMEAGEENKQQIGRAHV